MLVALDNLEMVNAVLLARSLMHARMHMGWSCCRRTARVIFNFSCNIPHAAAAFIIDTAIRRMDRMEMKMKVNNANNNLSPEIMITRIIVLQRVMIIMHH